MAESEDLKAVDGDEQWMRNEIAHRVGQLWMQHGDAFQETPESIEQSVRSPGYRRRKEQAQACGDRARVIMHRVMAEAAALGIDDYTSLAVKAWEDDEILKKLESV